MRILLRLSAFLLALSGATFSVADDNTRFAELLEKHWEIAKQEKVFFRTDPDTFRMNGTYQSSVLKLESDEKNLIKRLLNR